MPSFSHRYVLLFAAALLLGLVVANPAAAQPEPVSMSTMTPRRLGAALAVLVGLSGVLSAALDRAGRTGGDRRGAVIALVAGLVGAACGGLVVATAEGGLGTGQGLGGGVVAILAGLLSMLLGGLSRARSARTS